jgi:hypothetical protein
MSIGGGRVLSLVFDFNVLYKCTTGFAGGGVALVKHGRSLPRPCGGAPRGEFWGGRGANPSCRHALLPKLAAGKNYHKLVSHLLRPIWLDRCIYLAGQVCISGWTRCVYLAGQVYLSFTFFFSEFPINAADMTMVRRYINTSKQSYMAHDIELVERDAAAV